MQKPYDKNKIGKFIGWGGEHLVFEYGKDRVIKFSLHIIISGKSAVEKKKQDYKLARKYFDQYILANDIREYQAGKKAVEVQQKIFCRYFHKTDLRNAELKGQFLDILSRYEKMKQDAGYGFDLFGREGLLGFRGKQEISNILVTPEDKVILIDFATMHIKPKFYEWPLWLFIAWAKRRQEKLLKNFK